MRIVLRALAISTLLTLLGGGSALACGNDHHATARGVADHAGRAPLQIGDSTSIFAAPMLGALGIESNAKGCRQFGQALPMLEARRRAGTLPAVVVLSLGANGPIARGQIGRALAILGRSRILVLVTARQSPGSTGEMHRAAAAHPDRVLLVDWVRFSAGHGGWFGGDGLHVNPHGASAYAHLIRRAIAPYAFPPVRALRLPRHSTAAVACGSVRQGGRRHRVFIIRGHRAVLCARARELARRSPLRPADGWRTYDWRRTGDGPWEWVQARGRRIVVATLVTGAGDARTEDRPPAQPTSGGVAAHR